MTNISKEIMNEEDNKCQLDKSRIPDDYFDGKVEDISNDYRGLISPGQNSFKEISIIGLPTYVTKVLK